MAVLFDVILCAEHDASGKKVKKKVRGKKKKKESIETKHTCIRASTSSNGSDDENTPEEEKRCKKKKKQFKTVLSRMDGVYSGCSCRANMLHATMFNLYF